MKTCSIENCSNVHLARGYCMKHYHRWRVHGGPLEGSAFRDGAPQRFIEQSLTIQTDDCIIWPFSTNSDGYGNYGADGVVLKAHRTVCERVHGPAPNRHEAAHNCGRRNCINHRHLRWATHAENMADTIAHGTHNRGDRSGRAKLTWPKVRSIRARYAAGEDIPALAASFGVSKPAIYHVVLNERWIERSTERTPT